MVHESYAKVIPIPSGGLLRPSLRTHVARVDAPAVAETAGAELRAVDPVALPAVGGATALLSGDVRPAPLQHGRTQAVCSRGRGFKGAFRNGVFET